MPDSNFLREALQDEVIGGQDYTPPATLYWALYTSDPTAADVGTEVDTGDWSNYARVAITNNLTNFGASANGVKDNDILIDFGTAVIVTPPEVTHIGIRDAAAAGNLLKYAPLVDPKTINDGDPVSVPIGDADFSDT